MLFQVLSRHTDLEQSQNKAQGALLSVLALTQVTELKILLDVGSHGHRLYHFVLALLIGSIALQIFVGVIVIYIGKLFSPTDSTEIVCLKMLILRENLGFLMSGVHGVGSSSILTCILLHFIYLHCQTILMDRHLTKITKEVDKQINK